MTQTLFKLPLDKIKYKYNNKNQKFVFVITHSLHLSIITTLTSLTPRPPSTLAYSHLNQMFHSFLSAPVSSTSTTFTLPTTAVISTVSADTISFSSPLVSFSSILPSDTQSSGPAPLSLLPQDAVATLPHLQQFSAVRQLSRDLQQRKLRHPKRPQLRPQNE